MLIKYLSNSLLGLSTHSNIPLYFYCIFVLLEENIADRMQQMEQVILTKLPIYPYTNYPYTNYQYTNYPYTNYQYMLGMEVRNPHR